MAGTQSRIGFSQAGLLSASCLHGTLHDWLEWLIWLSQESGPSGQGPRDTRHPFTAGLRLRLIQTICRPLFNFPLAPSNVNNLIMTLLCQVCVPLTQSSTKLMFCVTYRFLSGV